LRLLDPVQERNPATEAEEGVEATGEAQATKTKAREATIAIVKSLRLLSGSLVLASGALSVE